MVNAQGGIARCSCKAAAYGNLCWHPEKVRSRLIREASWQTDTGGTWSPTVQAMSEHGHAAMQTGN